MVEWLNPSTIASSVLGSIIAGVLLLTAAPIWWKWVKIADTARFGEVVKTIIVVAVMVGALYGVFALLDYFERSSIPQHHPTLTEEEAEKAFMECEMESIKATAEITPLSERSAARQRYRAACLVNKGFDWE
ncbi:MAG: hypothetical protein F4133_13885 [Gammaproteobacteria bacterium]|nr:hypothetical protein [Gammaproteobacteria bacterium]